MTAIARMAAFAALIVSLTGAGAQDLDHSPDHPPDVPGDDIFGFTAPSSVGHPDEPPAIANENDARMGKRFGRYRALGVKVELSRSFTERLWGAVSVFGDVHALRNVPLYPIDRTMPQFDGVSTEWAYNLLRRRDFYPFAATLSIEPRWSRLDGGSGSRAQGWAAEAKLFIDAVVIPDTLYWAMNVNVAPQIAQIVGDRVHLQRSSGGNLSTALAWELHEQLVIGVEARRLATWQGAWMQRRTGRAVFVGPTLAWMPTERFTLNLTWQPQVAGHARGAPTPLDLDNFERANMRVKLALTF